MIFLSKILCPVQKILIFFVVVDIINAVVAGFVNINKKNGLCLIDLSKPRVSHGFVRSRFSLRDAVFGGARLSTIRLKMLKKLLNFSLTALQSERPDVLKGH